MSACLDSLCRQSYKGLDILVVDNGSTDGSIDFIKDNYPQVRVICNRDNLGFAEGNNIGIQNALNSGADYVLLLNNDTVSESDAVERMVEAFESDGSVGIAGPLIRNLEKKTEIVELGLDSDILGYPVNNLAARIREKAPHPFYVAGCAMMIRSDVFAAIGFLDPSYFIFVEDLDFCWRARLAGFGVLAVPEAIVYHKSGGTVQGGAVKGQSHTTSTFRLYLGQRNTMRTVLKNYDSWTLVWILPLSVITGLMTFVVGASVLRQPEVTKSYLRALLSNLRDMRQTLNSRILTQKLRTVSDHEILTTMSKKCSIARSYLGIGKFAVRRTT